MWRLCPKCSEKMRDWWGNGIFGWYFRVWSWANNQNSFPGSLLSSPNFSRIIESWNLGAEILLNSWRGSPTWKHLISYWLNVAKTLECTFFLVWLLRIHARCMQCLSAPFAPFPTPPSRLIYPQGERGGNRRKSEKSTRGVNEIYGFFGT